MEGKRYELYNVDSPHVEEAYNVLRTNVHFNTFSQKIKTITVVGFAPKQGKTFVAINLAIAFAKDYKNVLLVDADLRKPMGLKRLGGEDSIGLTSYICGECISARQVIFKTNIQNLSFVPMGKKPPNPAELISSFRFTEFLIQVRECYDIILIDTPCLGNVIDSAIIASKTDSSLIVIAPGAVDYHRARALKQQLEAANSNILGVVFNKAADYFDRDNHYFNHSLYFDTAEDVKKYAGQKAVRPNRKRRRAYD